LVSLSNHVEPLNPHSLGYFHHTQQKMRMSCSVIKALNAITQ